MTETTPPKPDAPIEEETGHEEAETVPLPDNLLDEDEPPIDTSPPDDQGDAGSEEGAP